MAEGRLKTELITKEWLQSKGACKESVKIFIELFPKGAELNLENLIFARKRGLNLCWLAKKLGFGSWTADSYDLKTAHKLWKCINEQC